MSIRLITLTCDFNISTFKEKEEIWYLLSIKVQNLESPQVFPQSLAQQWFWMCVWFTVKQKRAVVISLPAVSPNSAMTEAGRKYDYRVMQNLQLSLGPMNVASKEGIIGANVFPRPPCDFIIYCTTKWYFPPLGNKASIFNISQWNGTHGASYLGAVLQEHV